MMSEQDDAEAYERLVAMHQDVGETWDLSTHDKSAIAWALSQIDGHAAAIAEAEKAAGERLVTWHKGAIKVCLRKGRETTSPETRMHLTGSVEAHEKAIDAIRAAE